MTMRMGSQHENQNQTKAIPDDSFKTDFEDYPKLDLQAGIPTKVVILLPRDWH